MKICGLLRVTTGTLRRLSRVLYARKGLKDIHDPDALEANVMRAVTLVIWKRTASTLLDMITSLGVLARSPD
jgi:hypothetical protein